jgi:protoporphyrinogen oxidase
MVIGALPTPEFSRLLLNADEHYLKQLNTSRYLGLVCPALVLDRPLSNYWTLNLTDPSSPFSSIIEMPHPLDPRYHIIYLPKYTAPDNDWMGVSDSTILDAWLLRLRQIYPMLKPEHIVQQAVSRSRYVDPLHALNAAENLVPVAAPYAGLFLANSSQVYPHVPSSEAVIAHAQTVARLILAQSQRQRSRHVAA